MKNFFQFTPADFDNSPFEPLKPEVAATLANIKLQSAIEAAPLIEFGYEGKLATSLTWTKHSHQGRLICIEQLPKVECQHEPMLSPENITRENFDKHKGFPIAIVTNCKKCGVELKAKWEAVK